GAGAESRQDIGAVIVGGVLVGTFFTLFVIPAVYTYLTWRDAEPVQRELRLVGGERQDLLDAAE
ncbi:MAG TPA: efflux RND transporter permease subunit, partial [Afifellaceae bacterium]|nr:efflux RND transporter permease subunit [Afifellaceae bacterium]